MPNGPNSDWSSRQDLRSTSLAGWLEEWWGGGPSFVLEAGCGHGHFLTALAARYPNRRFLGIDICRDRITRALRKAKKAGLGNVSFHQAEALETLRLLPPSAKVEAAYLLFPDPWPKRRHHKNRLLRRPFLDLLAERMVPGGALHFRTDDDAYFRFGVRELHNHPDWEPQTEAIWEEVGETVFQAKAQAWQSLVATRTVPNREQSCLGEKNFRR